MSRSVECTMCLRTRRQSFCKCCRCPSASSDRSLRHCTGRTSTRPTMHQQRVRMPLVSLILHFVKISASSRCRRVRHLHKRTDKSQKKRASTQRGLTQPKREGRSRRGVTELERRLRVFAEDSQKAYRQIEFPHGAAPCGYASALSMQQCPLRCPPMVQMRVRTIAAEQGGTRRNRCSGPLHNLYFCCTQVRYDSGVHIRSDRPLSGANQVSGCFG